MKSIYFVDDESGVLNGLRRMLRDLRGNWNMLFHTSGQEALAEMERQPPDVVVSDMRMPGMDGAELLERVQNRFPSTVRIVLSGQAELSALARVMRSAHQILTKPCDAEQLRHVIANAGVLAGQFRDPEIAAAIGGMGALPSIPAVLYELMDLLQRPEVDQRVVSQTITTDPALTVRVLQVANSGFFASRVRIATVEQAVVMLGTKMLKNLVLHVKLVDVFPVASPSFSLESFGAGIIATTSLARRLAPGLGADELRALAMFADVGKLVLASRLASRYEEVIQRANRSGMAICSAEREILGVTHAQTGAHLMALWGQPPLIVERIARHHEPAGAGDDEELLTTLHVAECLLEAGGDRERFEAILQPAVAADSSRIDAWFGAGQADTASR